MKQRVTGAVLSYLLILIKLVITLLFTPFLVASLGVDGYGLFALVGAMAAYLYILDFGMNDAVLRFFITHENDPAMRDMFLARMLGLYSLLGTLVLLLTLGLSLILDQIFEVKNSPEQIEMIRSMLILTGCGAAVLVALNPMGALLSATESFVFLRSMEIAVTILSTLVMVAVLKAGQGPVELVMVTAAFTVLQALLRLVFAVIFLKVRVRMAWPHLHELCRVSTYAAPIFVSMIAEVVFWKFDIILIGATIGVASIAVYAIGVTFNKYFMSFATALSRVMTPEIIRRVDSGTSPEILTDMMIHISRIQGMFLMLILSGLIVFGERFLILWLGPEFALSYWIMLMVLVPYTLELTGNARNILLQVKGLYWHKSAITLTMAALNIPLTLMMLKIYGVVGAAFSTGLVILVGYFLIALLLRARVGMQMGRYWRQTAKGILPTAVVVSAAGVWAEGFLPDGWLALFLGFLVLAIFYTLLIALFGATAKELAFIKRVLTRTNERDV